jgi:hypothetical protein
MTHEDDDGESPPVASLRLRSTQAAGRWSGRKKPRKTTVRHRGSWVRLSTVANWTKLLPRIFRDRPMDSSMRDFQDRSGIDDDPAELIVVVPVSSIPPVPVALPAISCKPIAAMVSEASESAEAAVFDDMMLRFVVGLLAGLFGRRKMTLPKNGVVPVDRAKAAILLQRPCVVIMANSEREERNMAAGGR